MKLRAYKTLVALTMAAALWPLAVPARALNHEPKKLNKRQDTHMIHVLEDQWRQALLDRDMATLDRTTSSEFMGINPNGTISDKEQFLEHIRSGQLHFKSIEVQDRKVRILGGTAIVTSTLNVNIEQNNVEHAGIFRYTKVYRLEPDGKTWKTINFEVVRVSGRGADELKNGTPIPPQAQIPPAH